MIKEITKPPYLIRKYMNFWGFDGLATPWNTIYYKDAVAMSNKRLVRHEKKHIEQMDRDGKFKYMLLYNWYWLTVGYEKNPYEVEARKAENV